MSVLVYSGGVLVEEILVSSEDQLQKVADYWNDEGYRVRIVESNQ